MEQQDQWNLSIEMLRACIDNRISKISNQETLKHETLNQWKLILKILRIYTNMKY